MSFLSSVGHFFSGIGKLIATALGHAVKSGLTDELVQIALVWVRVAATKFVTDAEKRKFVIDILIARGIPEPVARIALELAVLLFKKELGIA